MRAKELQDLKELIERFKEIAYSPCYSNSMRKRALRDIRQLEKSLKSGVKPSILQATGAISIIHDPLILNKER